MIYKNRIKYIRERNDIKEISLSKILDISKSLYSEYENEIKTIPTKHMNVLCNYLNISFDYVFGFSEKSQYSDVNKLDALDKKIVGQNLKKIRKEHKLTQTELGKAIGCSYGTIAGYEIGRYLISIPILYRVCKKFNISADALLGRRDNLHVS